MSTLFVSVCATLLGTLAIIASVDAMLVSLTAYHESSSPAPNEAKVEAKRVYLVNVTSGAATLVGITNDSWE